MFELTVANMLDANYMLRQMRTRFRILPVLAGMISLVFLTGCGGIHAEKGFSPLSLLLPGIMRNEPEKPLMPDPARTPENSTDSDNEEENTA